MKMRYSNKLKKEMQHKKPVNWKKKIKTFSENALIALVYFIGIGVFILRLFI